MINIKKVEQISLQKEYGRSLRYVLQPVDLMDNDPFVILADDKFAHNTFQDHPHKGIQTVTYVLEGDLTHSDSKTGGGKLFEGDFQIMTAGRGIVHNENPDPGKEARVLQLWVNLSSEHKKEHAQYEDLPLDQVPVIELDGGKVHVYAGEINGVKSPLKLFTPFIYGVVTLEAGKSYHFPIPANYNSYLYMLEGEADVSQRAVKSYDVVHFEQSKTEDYITVQTKKDTKFVVFSGLPINEPVVARGPFVMNTEREIIEAFSDYRKGTFLDY